MKLNVQSNSLTGPHYETKDRPLWRKKSAFTYNTVIPENIIDPLNRKMVIF